ncbi:MAG: hypothetical protein AAFU56_05555 [Pseudomonadota bacterium]
MAGFEELLRSALAKHDNPPAEVRQRIYRSSRDALERMIQQKSGMPAETIALQRQKLEAAIVEVELNRTPPSDPAPPSPTLTPVTATPPAVQQPAAPPPTTNPPIGQPPNPAPEQKSAAGANGSLNFGAAPHAAPQTTPAPPPQAPAPSPEPDGDRDYDGDLLREKKPYAKLLFWAIIITSLGVTLWSQADWAPNHRAVSAKGPDQT